MRCLLGWTLTALIATGCAAPPQEPAAEHETAAAPAAPEIHGEEVTYEAGGVQLTGYLAYDAAQQGARPGVLVVHEWWGHNDYARRRARMLAEMGYTALALDMYGDGKVAEHPEDAQKFAMEVMGHKDVGVERFRAARSLLEAHPTTDPTRTAAIGYCFGGAVVLHMARIGEDLAGVASFHGDLSTQSPAEPGAVKTRILVLHGAEDPFGPPETVEAFKQEMDAAGADLKLIAYPGAVHSFTNPDATALGERFDMPLAYNQEADRQSWAELERFLGEVFGS